MRKALYDQLFRDMQYCPICGGELRRLGTGASQYKICPDEHGVMSVTGLRRGQNVGIFLEIAEE